MPIPLAVQSWSLRDQMEHGKHLEYFAKLAALGYRGIEVSNLYGMKPEEYRRQAEAAGLTLTSIHAGIEAGKEQQVIDTVKGLGLAAVVFPWTPPEGWATLDAVKASAERLEQTRQILARAGVSLLYHNHDFEMRRIDGITALERLAALVPGLLFEVDAYWACNFGAEDPARVVTALKSRLPRLHLKDGNFVKDQPFVASGAGKVDLARVVAVVDPKVTQWLVVELDSCATDMWTAIEDSYHYLIGKGLAAGSQPARAGAAKK